MYDCRRVETVWYLFVLIETRRGLERDARWSLGVHLAFRRPMRIGRNIRLTIRLWRSLLQRRDTCAVLVGELSVSCL
jgi:hypothetical protein